MYYIFFDAAVFCYVLFLLASLQLLLSPLRVHIRDKTSVFASHSLSLFLNLLSVRMQLRASPSLSYALRFLSLIVHHLLRYDFSSHWVWHGVCKNFLCFVAKGVHLRFWRTEYSVHERRKEREKVFVLYEFYGQWALKFARCVAKRSLNAKRSAKRVNGNSLGIYLANCLFTDNFSIHSLSLTLDLLLFSILCECMYVCHALHVKPS